MRSGVPVSGIAAVIVFQMVSLQQQIGDLRTDFHREIGDLRDDLRTEIGVLRERMTRLETLLESRAGRQSAEPSARLRAACRLKPAVQAVGALPRTKEEPRGRLAPGFPISRSS